MQYVKQAHELKQVKQAGVKQRDDLWQHAMSVQNKRQSMGSQPMVKVVQN